MKMSTVKSMLLQLQYKMMIRKNWSLIIVVFLQSARMRAAGVGKDFKENPNLRDNWTDAEGYYSK